jgi:hypothetical protein
MVTVLIFLFVFFSLGWVGFGLVFILFLKLYIVMFLAQLHAPESMTMLSI